MSPREAFPFLLFALLSLENLNKDWVLYYHPPPLSFLSMIDQEKLGFLSSFDSSFSDRSEQGFSPFFFNCSVFCKFKQEISFSFSFFFLSSRSFASRKFFSFSFPFLYILYIRKIRNRLSPPIKIQIAHKIFIFINLWDHRPKLNF